MDKSTVTPHCPQSTGPDRYGYRRLPAPREWILFRINSAFVTRQARVVILEYRGAEADLISAGIVPSGFFTPQPGRPREDAAGRGVQLRRLLEDTRIVTFRGDPFLEPPLPGPTRELVAEAIAEYERVHGTRDEIYARARGAALSQPSTSKRPSFLRLVVNNTAPVVRP